MSRRGMMSILRCDGSDLDFFEHFPLQRAHLIHADQFQQREKGYDDLHPRYDLTKQLRKTHRFSIRHALEDLLDLIRNAEPFAKNFLQILARFDAFNHFLKCVDQLENSNLVQWQRRIGSRRAATVAGENSLLLERAIVQLA